MTRTRDQLVNRALQELRVVGAGQSAAAEDTSFVNDEVEPLMADLASRAIYYWGEDNEVPDEAFSHLAVLLANSVAGAFGQSQSEEKRLLAERRLRNLNLYSLSGQTASTEYF
jgi:hypothetical protein